MAMAEHELNNQPFFFPHPNLIVRRREEDDMAKYKLCLDIKRREEKVQLTNQ